MLAVSAIMAIPGAALAQTSAELALPAAVEYPEGIVYDARHDRLLTAGSFSGQLARLDPGSGNTEAIGTGLSDEIGAASRGVLGMKLDQAGRLWMAGGATGLVLVVDPESGSLLHKFRIPGEGALINDLAIVGDRAFFTDTFRPKLWSVSIGGPDFGKVEQWIDFTGTPVDQPRPNLNGIVASADGRALLAIHMGTGRLFHIDIEGRQVTPVDLKGQTIVGGDGLVLDGQRLYVICQPKAQIVSIDLSSDLLSGEVLSRNTFPGLRAPATGAIANEHLFVVSPQFDRLDTNTPVRPFSVTKVALSALGQTANAD